MKLENAELHNVAENLVMATCCNKKSVILYDMAAYDGENLDHHEVWSFMPSTPQAYVGGGGISGIKYRESTVFGDVVIVCAGNGYAAIISYPEGKVLWEVFHCGANAHAIEILPSGNIVTAASFGNTIRLFAASAMLQNNAEKAAAYKEYPITDGHGVLWDPEYGVLWALGGDNLRAYSVAGEGTDQGLRLREDLGCRLAGLDGHDLSADFSDSRYLWVTGARHVYRFDKKTGELSFTYENCDILDRPNVKGFGNSPGGYYYFSIPNGGTGTSWEKERYCSWSTDRIHFCFPTKEGTSLKVRECVSKTNAYYKIFSFYGKYQ